MLGIIKCSGFENISVFFYCCVSSHTKREEKSKTLALAFILSVSYSGTGKVGAICKDIILPGQNSTNSTHTTTVRAGPREGHEAGDARGLPSAVQTASAELPTDSETHKRRGAHRTRLSLQSQGTGLTKRRQSRGRGSGKASPIQTAAFSILRPATKHSG